MPVVLPFAALGRFQVVARGLLKHCPAVLGIEVIDLTPIFTFCPLLPRTSQKPHCRIKPILLYELPNVKIAPSITKPSEWGAALMTTQRSGITIGTKWS